MNGFVEPGWDRSIDKVYSEEGESVLEATPLTVGEGAMMLTGGNAKLPKVFMEVLRDK